LGRKRIKHAIKLEIEHKCKGKFSYISQLPLLISIIWFAKVMIIVIIEIVLAKTSFFSIAKNLATHIKNSINKKVIEKFLIPSVESKSIMYGGYCFNVNKFINLKIMNLLYF